MTQTGPAIFANTPYFSELREKIAKRGGLFNAHLHLDRAGTYHATMDLMRESAVRDAASLSIAGKHALIPMIHNSALYDPKNLSNRVSEYLDGMVAVGTTRADSVVDTTTDRVGMSALEVFYDLKEKFRGRLDLKAGAYTPLGFRDDEPARWDLIEKAAKQADFVGLLPERDDTAMYPDHVGFHESCRRGITLARSLGKQIHIHADQANHLAEDGSETVLNVVRELGDPAPKSEPDIWLIHVISPSTYPEDRFQKLADGMAEHNIGIITCPSAAISMRQYRRLTSPTYNSIARVLDFLEKGVAVRMGSDNICDVTSPMGTVDLVEEMLVLSNAMRFYDTDILSKLASGQLLDDADRKVIGAHLEEDREMARVVEDEVLGRI